MLKAKRFWDLGRITASPKAEQHFIDGVQSWVEAVCAQSADRENDHVRSIDDYMRLRYHTSAVRPTFAMLELELHIPDEVYFSSGPREAA